MDVLFAVLPFADVERPAIGVSLLKAALNKQGIPSAVRYLNFDLAERIGVELYNWISHCGDVVDSPPVTSLIGEWLFAQYLFPSGIPGAAEYLAAHCPRVNDDRFAALLGARAVIPPLVERWADQIRREKPRIVGFTTSFDQTSACLAVAKRLRSLPEAPLIVLGGANCQGEMGWQLLQSFPWMDFICTGEGDEALPSLVERVLRGGDGSIIPGILGRHSAAATIPTPVWDMDSLPVPDYSDYAARISSTDLAGAITPRLLIETARGCWWGAKQHCTFCGLNGQTMRFRSKSPARVLRELTQLRQRYGLTRIEAVDNILDLRYLKTVFPEIARRSLDLELFYETKSNLTLDQVRMLRAGGVRMIQAGIESFSHDTLVRMRKGCTGLQNVQLLRWCEEIGIAVAWNLLYGLPGETAGELEWMTELIPLLAHLQPPACCEPVRMDRYSPLFADWKAFGVVQRRPAAAYRDVYPLKEPELEQLAYFFDFEYSDGHNLHQRAKRMREAAQEWTMLGRRHNRPRLDLFQTGPLTIITDTRPCAVRPTRILNGVEAEVYLSCDTGQRIESLAAALQSDVQQITLIVEALMDAKLMIEIQDRYLSLAVFRTREARPRQPPHGVQVLSQEVSLSVSEPRDYNHGPKIQKV
jgi:ribosomal peptide maturation radical SAM protein 1